MRREHVSFLPLPPSSEPTPFHRERISHPVSPLLFTLPDCNHPYHLRSPKDFATINTIHHLLSPFSLQESFPTLIQGRKFGDESLLPRLFTWDKLQTLSLHFPSLPETLPRKLFSHILDPTKSLKAYLTLTSSL